MCLHWLLHVILAAPSLLALQYSAGIMFRDTVQVTAVPDPKVSGITMFMSSVKDGRWKAKYVLSAREQLY